MTPLREMIATHPHVKGNINDPLAAAAESAALCAAICRSCADACLGEDSVADLIQCIRLDLDCADVCQAFSNVALRRAGGDVPIIEALAQVCEAACRRCSDVCREHGDRHEHCAICAIACEMCADACREARKTLGDAHHPAPAGTH